MKARYNNAKLENDEIRATEDHLNQLISMLEQQRSAVMSDPTYSQYAYVTRDDLKTLSFIN